MGIKQRMINCDFLNFGGFLDNISTKAKLLYFMFFINADDKGFVGNGLNIAKSLDQCEEEFENTLFSYKYVDSINELVNKGFIYEFSDKHDNKTYLIRHWFMHNKEQKFLTTNFIHYLAKVEIISGEYQMKNIERDKKENPYKGKQIIVKESKVNEINKELEINVNKEQENWEKDWDNIVKELSDPKESEK